MGYVEHRARAPTRSTAVITFLSLLVLSLSIALWSSRLIAFRCPECTCPLPAAPGLGLGGTPNGGVMPGLGGGLGSGGGQGGGGSEEDGESTLGFGMAIFSATLVGCALASYGLARAGMTFLPDCIAYVLIGVVVGSVLRLSGVSSSVGYALPNQQQFFLFILPPIILEAGFSLNKGDFLKEAAPICLFALVGTIVSSAVFGLGMFVVGITGASFTFSFWEAMAFGALISAVDPVATMAVFTALRVNKTLHFLVFGESVLNDAVAIVLYRTCARMIGSASPTLAGALADFVYVFAGSAAVGAATGTLAAWTLKRTSLYRTPSLELAVFFVFAYMPYFLCDGLRMSGIMGILVNGVTLAHYAFPNLSRVAQLGAQQNFKTLAYLAETFVFVYLGTALTTFNHSWHLLTVAWGILLVLVSRAANVFPLAAVANRYRAEPISRKNCVVMWFSGLRGAIAFALSLSFPAEDGSGETRRVVISTTLAIVLFTVIVLGGGTMPLLRLLRMDTGGNEGGLAGESDASLPLPGASTDSLGGGWDDGGNVSGGSDQDGGGSGSGGVGSPGGASSPSLRGRWRAGGRRDPTRPSSRFGLDDSGSSAGEGAADPLTGGGRGGEAGAAASTDLLGGPVPSRSPRWVGEPPPASPFPAASAAVGSVVDEEDPAAAAAATRPSQLPLLARLDEEYLKPLLLAAPDRSHGANSRALARLSAAGDAMLSPEEMGAVLAAPSAAAVAAAPAGTTARVRGKSLGRIECGCFLVLCGLGSGQGDG